ncbi:MAG: hypothetical protein SFY81_13555 [Verrucomicrobiota bacterium]|nr:hypothetical protein [Verrucomicrobiota bacterium]
MNQHFLRSELLKLTRFQRRWSLFLGFTICWTTLFLLCLAAHFIFKATGSSSPLIYTLIIGGGFLWAFFHLLKVRRNDPGLKGIAKKIESTDPSLNSLLLAAVEEIEKVGLGTLNFLQAQLLSEALVRYQQGQWHLRFLRRLRWIQAAHLLSFISLLLLLSYLAAQPIPRSRFSLARLTGGVEVIPGNASIERGTPLAISADFFSSVPTTARLQLQFDNGSQQTIPLARALKDSSFGGTIDSVREGFTYKIIYDSSQTAEFRIKVFDFPELQKADANLTFPAYTELQPKKFENTRRVTAVEGSDLDYTFYLNKPVRLARLLENGKPVITLTNLSAAIYQTRLRMDRNRKLDLELIDEASRTNKIPIQFVLEATPNKLPNLKFAFPKGDQKVSPLEEFLVEGNAEDDFGLLNYGIGFAVGGEDPKLLKLGTGGKAFEKRPLSHLFPLEQFKTEPDQLVSYFLWAEDKGPDGQVRQHSSDMFFAEIRHFDELFRQGQSDQSQGDESQQQQQGGESAELVKIQKEIISATWNLHRNAATSSKKLAASKDLETIHSSQEKALQLAGELQDKMRNPKLKTFAEEAVHQMKLAVERLDEVRDAKSTDLSPALASERSAYQALLRLQAREYQVSRQRAGRGGGGGESGNQQQLDQLELKEEANRYETQSQARSQQQNAETREQLQVLNRLRELARRQQDIAEQIKELQAALQAAPDQAREEELRRKLKRLQEEQQELVQDMDEVGQRMNSPENQSRMAEARQQLEKTREQARNTEQSLQGGNTSEALTSASRTQRDLKKMSEDLRKEAASGFKDELREMRQQARDLAEGQQKLHDQIAQLSSPDAKKLDTLDQKQQALNQLEQQQQQLTNLLSGMRELTQNAEASEPLLSRQLYETLRRTDQGNIPQQLEMTSELLNRSFTRQALEFEGKATQQIKELQQGIERAAGAVLGDEAESLRLAQNTLDELTSEAAREAAPAPNQEPGSNPRNGQNPSPSQSAENSQSRQSSQANASSGGQQPSSNRNDDNQEQPGSQGRSTAQNNSSQQQGEGEGQGQAQREGREQGNGQGQPGERAGNGNQNRNPQSRFFDQLPNRGGNGTRAGGPGSGEEGPITGENFAEWSDRLRDVEEMLESDELRNDVARVLDRARSMRSEYKRHSKEPNRDMVQLELIDPLKAIRSRVAEQLARIENKEAIVPVDRDPVPQKYSELVNKYYEQLGRSEP